MNRALVSAAVLAVSVSASACAPEAVGEPCLPSHPTAAPGAPRNVEFGADAGFFEQGEVYIETRSLQCRTRVCMAYKWDEENQPDQRSRRVFCTCRCGGPEGAGSGYCSCPDKFVCTTVFNTGDPGIRGSYCVRSAVVSDAGS